jgi:hypothetical protein
MALTRSDVARRIGKSIATVRRLEAGGELNPTRSYAGVHIFDEHEVAELAERFAARERIPAARSCWLREFPSRRETDRQSRKWSTDVVARELADVRRENDALRQRLRLVRSAVELWLEEGPTEDVIDALRLAL